MPASTLVALDSASPETSISRTSVCPWNKFAQTAHAAQFHARKELVQARLVELARLDDQAFRTMFSKSAIMRIGRARFVRNVLIAIGNSSDDSLAVEAERLLDDPSPLVRAMAVGALGRLSRLPASCDDVDPPLPERWQFFPPPPQATSN